MEIQSQQKNIFYVWLPVLGWCLGISGVLKVRTNVISEDQCQVCPYILCSVPELCSGETRKAARNTVNMCNLPNVFMFNRSIVCIFMLRYHCNCPIWQNPLFKHARAFELYRCARQFNVITSLGKLCTITRSKGWCIDVQPEFNIWVGLFAIITYMPS